MQEDAMIPYLKKRLGKERFLHSERTANEAVRLAAVYGADKRKAYLAGMLHDIGKGMSAGELVKTASENGISIDKYEKDNPELLHGKVSAHLAKTDLGITDGEILAAIESHTTGRKNMTLLEKIVYIADLIEPGRNFEGLREIRELAYKDIDAAARLALSHVMLYVKEKGLTLHPNSAEAYEYLKPEDSV